MLNANKNNHVPDLFCVSVAWGNKDKKRVVFFSGLWKYFLKILELCFVFASGSAAADNRNVPPAFLPHRKVLRKGRKAFVCLN